MDKPLKEKTLEATPTWAVAAVCFILVAISFAIEQIFHHTESWLKKKRKSTLRESLEKLKAELMLLGFISLLLTILQTPLSDICVSRKVGHSWHPCKYADTKGKYYDPCLKKGKIQLVSAYGIHQLHIFIFVLAVCHILFCIITYALGKAKMRKWKAWEDETKTDEYQYYNDPERFRLARETSFGRRHLHFWSRSPILLWIVCFFRQFIRSVAKVDYFTLRHGFITEHLPPQSQPSFNFQKYIDKSLEEDFNVIVGISPVIWLCAVLFLLTNTNGWYSYFWLPFIPLIIVLSVGTKLQVIITKMGTRILERGDVIKGSPVVQPGDDLFWFGRPRFLLFLIHFVLFLNAFQLAFLAWSWYEFGYPSCYHENIEDIVIRVVMGIVVQFLCSYVTLPLYALVNQMGSTMKPVIFSNHVASALRGWHRTAKKHVKNGHQSGSTTPFSSRPASPLHGGSSSPLYLLQGYKKSIYEEEHEVWEGRGDERSPPPSIPHEADEFSRKDLQSETSVVEIERDIESPPSPNVSSSRNGNQGRGSLNDFSFINRENER